MMLSLTAMNSFVEIVRWEAKKDAFSEKAIKHLDLGSANYGPDTSPSNICVDGTERYPDPWADLCGRKKHRVLFYLADHIIKSHAKQTKFLFYLLDISASGLDYAATNLSFYLRMKYKNKGLTIRIEKIAQDYFKMISFPEVDSASWLHPNYTVALPVLGSTQNSPNSRKLVKLLSKITAVSKKGIIIKESNLNGRVAFQLRNKMSVLDKPTVKENLKWSAEDMGYIPRYIFPSGSRQSTGDLSYRIMQAAVSSNSEMHSVSNRDSHRKRKREEEVLEIKQVS